MSITVTPASNAVGAFVSGVDIAAGLSDEQFTEIRQAFVDHGVIFLRGQDITPTQHIEFAERWSEININRFFQPVEGYPNVAEVRKDPDQIRNIGSNWHTDHSYDDEPAMGSILYARDVPDVGGDTMFAGQCAAYEALSSGMKETLGRMWAHHSSRHAFGALAYLQPTETAQAGNRIGNPELATQDSRHPVIIKHPLSGRPALYVNGDFTVNFDGWTKDESEPLLQQLYAHASRPEFTYRFKWKKGSMAIWDNRAVQHNAINDYPGEFRLMHRITLEGESLEPFVVS